LVENNYKPGVGVEVEGYTWYM